MALGAQRASVVRMVVGYASLLVTSGLAIGIAASLGVGRMIASQLFVVKPTDPGTYAAVALTLFATGLLSCAIPAFRATRVDPLIALRDE
jgi:putative ABC transport system permease protein